MKTQVYAADRRHRNEEVGGRVKFNLEIKKKKKITWSEQGRRMQKCLHLKYLRNELKVESKGGRQKDGEEKGT